MTGKVRGIVSLSADCIVEKVISVSIVPAGSKVDTYVVHEVIHRNTILVQSGLIHRSLEAVFDLIFSVTCSYACCYRICIISYSKVEAVYFVP